jgi:hypothetical protein
VFLLMQRSINTSGGSDVKKRPDVFIYLFAWMIPSFACF